MVQKKGSWYTYEELHNFLDVLSWAIRHNYGHHKSDILLKLVPMLDEKNINYSLSSHNGKFDKSTSMNSLWHSWYTECDLNFPNVNSARFDDTKEEMKEQFSREFYFSRCEYSAWKYVKTYYAIFFSLSAMLRVANQTQGGHTTILNLFKQTFYTSSFDISFFPYPFNLFLLDGNPNITIKDDQFSQIVYSLKKSRDSSVGLYNRLDRKRFTIYDALFLWRNKINYTSVYSFIKCYGSSYKSFFYGDITRLIFTFNIVVEIFLIKCFGYKFLKEEFNSFNRELKKSKLEPYPVNTRFDLYEHLISNKNGYF